MNKSQYLASVSTDLSEQIVNEDLRIYLYGGAAVVTSGYRVKGTNNGRPFDTWGKIDGKWQCVVNQETLVKE